MVVNVPVKYFINGSMRRLSRANSLIAPCMRRRYGSSLLPAIFLFGVFLTSGSIEALARNASPTTVEISLNEKSSKRLEFQAEQFRIYLIDIEFEFATETARPYVRRLVGGPPDTCVQRSDCGATFPFELTIRDSEGISKHDVREESRGHYAFTSNKYSRNLLRIPLKSGKYYIDFTVSEPSSEFVGVKTYIAIKPDPRSGIIGR